MTLLCTNKIEMLRNQGLFFLLQLLWKCSKGRATGIQRLETQFLLGKYLSFDLKFVFPDVEDIRFYAEDWCSKVKERVG